MGDLIPTPLGEQLLPVVTGISRILIDANRAEERRRRDAGEVVRPDPGEDERLARAYADFMEACTHAESLELQLRGPDGKVIPTEDIGVQDTEFLLALARESEETGLASSQEWDPEIDAILADDAVFDDGEDGNDVWDLDDEEPRELWKGYDDGEIEEGTFPRYQIQVQLLDEDAVP